MSGQPLFIKLTTLVVVTAFISGVIYLLTYDPHLSYASKIHQHPVFKSKNWSYLKPYQLEQRVKDPPEILLDYLNITEKKNIDFAQHPNLTQEIRQVLREFPPPLIQFMEKHLIGVFVVPHLDSSALTLTVEDWKGFKNGLIVINADKMLHSANWWHNLRLETNFIRRHSRKNITNEPLPPQWKVRSIIIDPYKDKRKELLKFLILHELGHIYAVVTGIENHYYKDQKPIRKGSFASLSWITPWHSKFDIIMPSRNKLNFYHQHYGSDLRGDIPLIMKNFEQTNFPSLYACLNPSEDFAESFALYIHTQILGNPFILEVFNETEMTQRIEDPFAQPRLDSKRRFIKQHLREHLGLN